VVVLFYAMAFCSGVAALIYEITWARMLGLTFGSTTLSAAAVIAGFMGGMGLGASLYHLAYDRVSRALALYAALEFGIAVTTALLTRTFYDLPDVFARVGGAVPPGLPLAITRFGWVFVLLLIPAMLMGATFPALCTVMIQTAKGLDRHLGKIYGINTIGAAAGALIAGLLLMERIGLTNTVTVANAVNVAVGLAALWLLRTPLAQGDARAAPAAQAAIPTYLPRWITGIVLFVSGFATLAYEILWFRGLRFMVGNSTHALTIVLLIFLVGLGLGALLLQRVARRQAPERDLALCQLLIAVLGLACMVCQTLLFKIPEVYDHLSILSHTVRFSTWSARLAIACLVATITMLPATLFMGLSFPLASRLFLGDVRKLGTRIGSAYLLANLGSILGSLLAAVLLLPLFSTIGGTKVVAGVNLVLAGMLLACVRRQARRWRVPVVAGVAFSVVMTLVLPASLSRVSDRARQGAGIVLFSKDGDLATVEVHQDPQDERKKWMTIDGAAIGWSDGFRQTKYYHKQVMLAHLPMVLDTRIRTTLNMGLGSSATLNTLAGYPEVETLDCVEINAPVVEGARLFPESRVFEDPRVNVVVDDAVHFLLRVDRQYDLIISDGKQDPFYSGNAPLLCREFYQYAFDRLTDAGLFIQWFPLGVLHRDLRINLHTLCDVFPYLEVFAFPPDAIMMLGSRQPVFDRPVRSDERFKRELVARDLSVYLIDHPTALLACWAAGKPQVLALVGDEPLCTWDHLQLDYSAYKAHPDEWSQQNSFGRNSALLLEAERVPRPKNQRFELSAPAYRESAALVRQAYVQAFAGNVPQARALAEQAVHANPHDRIASAVFLNLSQKEAQLRRERRTDGP
jgi:spermidine synthase